MGHIWHVLAERTNVCPSLDMHDDTRQAEIQPKICKMSFSEVSGRVPWEKASSGGPWASLLGFISEMGSVTGIDFLFSVTILSNY